MRLLSGRYKSKSGLGRGIVGAKLLMDRFQLASDPGKELPVELAKTLPKAGASADAGDPREDRRRAGSSRAPSPWRRSATRIKSCSKRWRMPDRPRNDCKSSSTSPRAMAGSLVEGVIAVNLEGHVTFFNRAAEGLLGWANRDALHRRSARSLDLPQSTAALLRVPSMK